MMKGRRLLRWAGVLGLLLQLHAAGALDVSDASLSQFIQEMVEEHHFSKADLETSFKAVLLQQKVLELFQRPAEVKPWHVYRRLFVTPRRIEEGLSFWERHEKALSTAEEKYGVPAEYVVGIIGIESFYGRNVGHFPVLDTLTTLAFHHEKRGPFFRQELKEFLLLAREQGLSRHRIQGSYAGAMGPPQFMPSSYRRYGIDATQKGQVDLIKDADDVIASIAHYFKAHGWDAHSPVVIEATWNEHFERLKGTLPLQKDSDEKPNWSLQVWCSKGICPLKDRADWNFSNPVNVFEVLTENGPSYRMGTHNFYVITRYNRSLNYALAVSELAAALKEGRHLRQVSFK